MRSIVLLRIQPNGISLFGSNQNAQTGPPLTFYSSGIISFCGAYNEDRRFFGLVTCTNSSRIYSCHVFMVDSKLLSHLDHCKRARSFGIQCNSLPMPKYGQVLGLQECVEFPATADPILSSIVRLHGQGDGPAVRTPITQRSPSEASTRLESTNSSNSDSGVGFRDDSDRNSAQMFNGSETMFDNLENGHRFPTTAVMGYPSSHKRSSIPSFSSRPPNCVGYHDDSTRSGGGSRSSSLPGVPILKSRSFNEDPLSLQEILDCDVSPNMSRKSAPTTKIHSNPPSHIEVSVVVTPRTVKKEVDNNSLKQVEEAANSPNCKLSRSNTGTRSLDDLCCIDAYDKEPDTAAESRGNIGSTPTLNQVFFVTINIISF